MSEALLAAAAVMPEGPAMPDHVLTITPESPAMPDHVLTITPESPAMPDVVHEVLLEGVGSV
jgi:hypothetical protein